MKADLGDRALVTHHLAAGIETSFAARAFDGGIDPHAFLGFLAQHLDYVDGSPMTALRGPSQRLDLLAPIWIRLADEDLRGTQSRRGERRQCTDRSGAGDQHGAAATAFRALAAVEGYRRRLYERTLLVV